MNKFSQLFLPVVAFSATVLLGLVLVFDREVGAALIMLVVLSAATVFVLRRLGVSQREVYVLLAFVIVTHAAFALFTHYTGFQPFGTGGGDFTRYNFHAQEVAERVRDFNFSLEGIWIAHYFPLLLGYVYALVVPAMVVGQLFVVWTAALSVLVLYFLTLQIGATRSWAFLVAFLGSLYPSFFFYTSYTLKDGLVILLALFSLLLLLKMLKRFSWTLYALLFLAAIPLVNLRAEIYDVFAITFLVFWFGFSRMELKRRMLLGFLLLFLYGLPPVIAMQGTQSGSYFDYKSFVSQLNIETAITLKENAYLAVFPLESAPPPKELEEKVQTPKEPGEKAQEENVQNVRIQKARSSTVADLNVGEKNLSSFLLNQVRAFAFPVPI